MPNGCELWPGTGSWQRQWLVGYNGYQRLTSPTSTISSSARCQWKDNWNASCLCAFALCACSRSGMTVWILFRRNVASRSRSILPTGATASWPNQEQSPLIGAQRAIILPFRIRQHHRAIVYRRAAFNGNADGTFRGPSWARMAIRSR